MDLVQEIAPQNRKITLCQLLTYWKFHCRSSEHSEHQTTWKMELRWLVSLPQWCSLSCCFVCAWNSG